MPVSFSLFRVCQVLENPARMRGSRTFDSQTHNSRCASRSMRTPEIVTSTREQQLISIPNVFLLSPVCSPPPLQVFSFLCVLSLSLLFVVPGHFPVGSWQSAAHSSVFTLTPEVHEYLSFCFNVHFNEICSCETAKVLWWMPDSMCLPRMICRCHVQWRRLSRSPTNRVATTGVKTDGEELCLRPFRAYV